jgi:hypothetical protein
MLDLTTIVTPDTIVRWHRELVTKKFDSSEKHGQGGLESVRKSRTRFFVFHRESHVGLRPNSGSRQSSRRPYRCLHGRTIKHCDISQSVYDIWHYSLEELSF